MEATMGLGTVQMRHVWTFEDLQQLDVPDWWRYEIVDGSLVVSPSTGGSHEVVSEEVRAALRNVLPAGYLVVGPMGVAIGDSYLVPDLIVARRDAVVGTALVQPFDVVLAVEVVSPGSVTMDRIVKPAKYAAAGIAHYWRVETDPVGLTAYALAPGEQVYVEAGSWGADEIATPAAPYAVQLDLHGLLG